MTLILRTDTPVPVSAWRTGDEKLQLNIGTSFACLDHEQAAELAQYLTDFAFEEKS